MDSFKIIIHNKEADKYFAPAVLDGAELSLELTGAPGKLVFSAHKDEILDFKEGDTVQLVVDGAPCFFGYVFKKKRNREQHIEVTAYDQLRYLKNKDSITYKGKKASELITMLAEDFQLKVGDISDTGFVIDKRTEDNVTLADMIQTALDITMMHTKKLFVLFDDFGKLTLKEPSALWVPILINNRTAQNFAYESGIDNDTYNLVKLVTEDKESGEHKAFYAPMTPDEFAKSDAKKQWGVLQMYEKLDRNAQSPQELAKQLLAQYNVVRRKLSIDGAAGDIRVRAGSLIAVSLELGDVEIAQKMLVTKVTHSFYHRDHQMNLTLRGGVINAE